MTGFSKQVSDAIAARSRKICEVQVSLDVIEKFMELQPKRRERIARTFKGCQGKAVHKHHRRNRGKGGDSRAETNALPAALHACQACHDFIGGEPAVAYVMGWLVSLHENPASVPVVYRGQLVVLDDLGGYEVAA